MLASNGDVIALLGTAQQELSIRRRYKLQHALPKDTASLCSKENIPITDKHFGDDADKAIKTAREAFKIKNSHSGGQRPHPYKHEQNRPFLGQTPHSAVSRGATAASGGKQNLGTREGKESSGEKNH